jgi:hypothetical protein
MFYNIRPWFVFAILRFLRYLRMDQYKLEHYTGQVRLARDIQPILLGTFITYEENEVS